ncbi:hypothetical protein HK099_000763 [Clydaea vesicula]|uniref:Polysaccharide biosynthesis domain-containing protein n=1 Tax=Clydaea vesicula TaxID=447962 RepID=A0AAD5TUZ8_9FUNG|nr:hypothetical protein HK099_000763 [Clydaea vesicula]
MLGFEIISETRKRNHQLMVVTEADSHNAQKVAFSYEIRRRKKNSLTDNQMLAIFTILKIYEYGKIDSGPKLLVFGLGHDALFWYKQYFMEPWLMDVPAEIKSECFDVVVIDGPTGNTMVDPGKMESAFFAVETAKNCILDNKLDFVYIFMHDCQRMTEKMIIDEYFWEGELIVKVHGDIGDLYGWKFDKKSIFDKTNSLKKQEKMKLNKT